MKLRAILAFAVAMAGFVLVGPAANATAYPPTTCPALSVSTTTPLAGESIVVSGTNFTPNTTIRIELHTAVTVLATVKSSAAGTFTTTVTLPAGVTGSHTIVAVGGGTEGCPASPITIGIQTGPSSTSTGGPPNGPPAFTGVDVLLLLLAAAVLLGAGIMFNRGGKRRRAAEHARL